MDWHIKGREEYGFLPVVPEGDPRTDFIEFGLLRLRDGEEYRWGPEGKEAALVVLGGRCTVYAGVEAYEGIGERQDVFSGEAHAVFVPPGHRVRVVGLGDVEVAVCKAPSDREGPPRLIFPGEVRVRSVGKLNWRRDVKEIVGPQVSAQHLLVGETVNPPGNWSSSPPHRHDFDRPPEEADMEEVYFFKVKPRQGFGIQRIYTEDRDVDEVYVVEDGDTVVIPRGYHPVVAGPGYRLCYLWVLAGRERILLPYDDPAHRWLKDVEPIVEEAGLQYQKSIGR